MSAVAQARAYRRLIRWLGPWASPASVPTGVEQREHTLAAATSGERPLRIWTYRRPGKRPLGSYLLVQGLHYEGPADVRFDRFARILADAGFLIWAPFLPDHLELCARPGATDDTRRALRALLADPERPSGVQPGIFSISFGSAPALLAATDPELAAEIGGLVLFGGYADWAETVEFMLTGEIDGEQRYQTNSWDWPAIFLNLLADLDGRPEDPSALIAAWHRLARTAWPDPEMQEPARYEALAHDIAADLPEAQRLLFLQGCNVAPGAADRIRAGLARSTERFARLDVRPHLDRLRCPVTIAHGVDDDVIPYTQLERLREAMPEDLPIESLLTGLYGHTTRVGLLELVQQVPLAVRELRTMLRLLRAIVTAATRAEL